MSQLIQRLERNTQGHDWIVGDVHGHFTRLQEALDEVNFQPAVDRLICAGDLVDRGPESMQALDKLQMPWLFAVQGNHERMAIDYAEGNAPRDWYSQNGGIWNIANTRDVQMEVRESFLALPIAIEIDTPSGFVGVVHADVPMRSWIDFTRELEDPATTPQRIEQLTKVAVWNRSRIELGDTTGVRDVHLVVVGHTPVRQPLLLGNVLHIDTGAWFGGGFTLVNISTQELHLSHQQKTKD